MSEISFRLEQINARLFLVRAQLNLLYVHLKKFVYVGVHDLGYRYHDIEATDLASFIT